MKKILLVFSIVVILSISLMSFTEAEAQGSRKVFIYFKAQPSSADMEGLLGLGATVRHTFRDMPVISAEIPVAAAQRILKNPNVDRIEDVEIVHLLGRVAKSQSGDPQQIPWGISGIKADQAWSVSKGTGIKVAVLDTGVDLDHSDLVANLAWSKSEIGSPTADDKNGHGTHVSGTVLAVDNAIGVVGVAPEAKLYALQVLRPSGTGYADDITKGVEDARYGPDGILATGDEANIISMSLGGPSPLGTAFEYQMITAYSERIVLVAAAGNDGTESIDYPAAYPEVIAVGATDQNNVRASFSDYGADLELVAPGVDVLSTYKGDSYAYGSGTSMSTPHVSGTVALMLTTTPDAYDLDHNGIWSPDEIRNKLHATSTDLGTPDWDKYYGYGLVNALGAVTQSKFATISGGTAIWTTEKAYRGSYSAKLTVIDGTNDVGVVEIQVDIPLNQIGSLTFWKYVDQGWTAWAPYTGWNPNILLGIDNDGDGVYRAEDFAWKFSYPSYNPGLLHGDSFIQGEAPIGLTSLDTNWKQINAFAYAWYSPKIDGLGYGDHYGPLSDYQTTSIEGINPSAHVKVIKIYIGEASSWMNEVAYVDVVIMNDVTFFN